jgi:hypothetical protein
VRTPAMPLPTITNFDFFTTFPSGMQYLVQTPCQHGQP